MFRTSLIVALALVLNACATATVDTTEDILMYQAEHQSAAILPYTVNITFKKLPEGMTEDDVKAMQYEESYSFQKFLHTQILSGHAHDEYTVEIQNVDKTNSILARNDITADNLVNYTKGEVATLLGVDSIISGTITRTLQPQLDGDLLFVFGITNPVHVKATVHDGDTGRLLWSYEDESSGRYAFTQEAVAKSLIKDIAKKLPYRKT